jgi:hypothetical protein
VRAQNIWENPNSQVYGYLNRMAQKGLIQLNDLIKPINRVDIQYALHELTSKSELLTPIEKIELNFYLQEYTPLNSNDSTIQIIKKELNNLSINLTIILSQILKRVSAQEINRIEESVSELFRFHIKHIEKGAEEKAPNFVIKFTSINIFSIS